MEGVTGSIPVAPTNKNKGLRQVGLPLEAPLRVSLPSYLATSPTDLACNNGSSLLFPKIAASIRQAPAARLTYVEKQVRWAVARSTVKLLVDPSADRSHR